MIPGSIVFSSILISAAILTKQDIEFLQNLASIVGSSSLLVAVLSYLYHKNRDTKIIAVEQISFFRKEIIPSYSKFINHVRKSSKNRNYKFQRIIFSDLSIENIKNFKAEIENQIQTNTYTKREFSIDQNFSPVTILNMLQELSLKIIHFKAENDPSLICIKNVFVEIVEVNVLELIFLRKSNPNSFDAVLKIYYKWSGDVFRKQPEEILIEIQKEMFDNDLRI